MGIFTTCDAVAEGQFFWKSLQKDWPFPFDITNSGEALLLIGNIARIVIVKQPLDDGDERWFVEVKEPDSDDVLLAVLLTADMSFIHASAVGMPLDEVGAVDTLKLFALADCGEWQQGRFPQDPLEDEQHV
jgi:hypothetical protein